ncbi:MAG TPA: methyltransferase dimerization domain-containing protein, partial [Candidatus Sulfopaludibacter sp.]|nr:methyltransferase dimerization domain-containing protein [Candidatus Sulfopaludibacter sp.]
FRMAAAGIGSQVLLFALSAGIFDHLEQWRTAQELAGMLGLNRHALAETLECLVSLRLVEGGAEGYRNLELASRYLVEDSAQSLKPALMALAAHLAPVRSIGRYVLDGRQNGAPAEFDHLQKQACECQARFSAPFVLDKVDLSNAGNALLIGWGGEVYRDLASQRWPDLSVEVRNPFDGELPADPGRAFRGNGGPYGAVLLSGLLACCDREQFRPTLASAANLLAPHGTLILHDAFLQSETAPPPEVMLSALKRHVIQGGSRNWPLARLRGELASLGLRVVDVEGLPGGMHLVTAKLL